MKSKWKEGHDMKFGKPREAIGVRPIPYYLENSVWALSHLTCLILFYNFLLQDLLQNSTQSVVYTSVISCKYLNSETKPKKNWGIKNIFFLINTYIQI